MNTYYALKICFVCGHFYPLCWASLLVAQVAILRQAYANCAFVLISLHGSTLLFAFIQVHLRVKRQSYH
jgi:hypothetical protein